MEESLTNNNRNYINETLLDQSQPEDKPIDTENRTGNRKQGSTTVPFPARLKKPLPSPYNPTSQRTLYLPSLTVPRFRVLGLLNIVRPVTSNSY